MKRFVIFFVVLMVSLGWLQAAEPVGKILSVSGQATHAHGLKPVPAEVGADVFEKDRIKTEVGAEVVIDMNGASKITIGPGSYFKIAAKDEKQTDLKLFAGNLNCKVNKLGQDESFTVKTPSAVAGVRGTEFDAILDQAMNTMVACSEGEVWNAAPGSPENVVTVNAGQMGLLLATGVITTGGFDPNADVSKLAQKLFSQINQNLANEVLQTREQMEAELRHSLLQLLEERISLINERLRSIEAETQKRTLPEPPAQTPNI